MTLAALADAARASRPRAAATRVVGIDGPAGAGKTTLAARLAEQLGGAQVLHMDDLYPGWDGLAEAPARLLEWVLEPLSRGAAARYRRWDWAGGHYAEWHEVPVAPVLVVEGCGAGVRAIAPYLSLLVWVEAPEELRMRRGIERDGEAFAPHWRRWAERERALFAAEGTRRRADLRVDGSVPLDAAAPPQDRVAALQLLE